MKDELKPCPFCGGKPYIFEDDKSVKRWVSCTDCEADGPHDQIATDVIKSWNRRHVDLEGLEGVITEVKNDLVYLAKHTTEYCECGICKAVKQLATAIREYLR